MHATIDVRFTISIGEDKTVPLATLAEFVTDQNTPTVTVTADSNELAPIPAQPSQLLANTSSTFTTSKIPPVNYPDLPRSGLPGPRLLGSGLPGSVSERASDVDTAAPDSAGGFPSQAVWSVPLLPGSKRGGESVCELCGRCIPSLLRSGRSVAEGGLAPSPQKLMDASLAGCRRISRDKHYCSPECSSASSSEKTFSSSPGICWG